MSAVVRTAIVLVGVTACVGQTERTLDDPGGATGDDTAAPGPDGPVCETPARERSLTRWSAWQTDRVLTDLLGAEIAVARDLPPEVGAWENRFVAQSVSPGHVDAWDEVGRSAATLLLDRGPRRWTTPVVDLGLDEGDPIGVSLGGTWWALTWTRFEDDFRTYPFEIEVGSDGTYTVALETLILRGFEGREPGETSAFLSLALRNRPTQVVEVTGVFDSPDVAAWDVDLRAGVNDLVLRVQPGVPNLVLALHTLEVSGPVDDPFATDGDARRRWVGCDLDGEDGWACAEDVATAFAARAWRRAVDDDERAALTGLVALARDEDDPPEVGVRLAVRAALLSPHFWFHADAAGVGTRSERVAARLARMLWSSVPDDGLVACAEAGGLVPDAEVDNCTLDAQVRRMLDHPRADAVVADFGRQWLGLDALDAVTPDADRFPGWDPGLVGSMRAETLAVLDDARTGDVPLPSLLASSRTFVDAALAPTYGTSVPDDGALHPVTVTDRAGLLGHASFLVGTSPPDRTSPVQRGVWVLQRMLCDAPDAPPPNVPALDPVEAADGDLRSLLEAHRANAACASCHDAIDPLGLALEGYDALGRSRTAYDDGTPVDTEGVLPDGTEVAGLFDLAEALAADPQVSRCLEDQLLAWTQARVLDEGDTCLREHVDAAVAERGLTFEAVLEAVATSGSLGGAP